MGPVPLNAPSGVVLIGARAALTRDPAGSPVGEKVLGFGRGPLLGDLGRPKARDWPEG